MISHKIRALKTTLSLADGKALWRNKGLMSLIQRQLSEIHEGVVALEEAQVPQAVRLPRELAALSKLPKLKDPANDRRRA